MLTHVKTTKKLKMTFKPFEVQRFRLTVAIVAANAHALEKIFFTIFLYLFFGHFIVHINLFFTFHMHIER